MLQNIPTTNKANTFNPAPATQPQIFEHPAFGNLRAIQDEATGEPLFVARDAALALGYKRPDNAMAIHCKHRRKVHLGYSLKQGGTPFLTVIPESDLYRLIMSSKLPSAQKFADWVFEEVLPAIRKHGGYIKANPEDSPEIILSRAVLVADATIKDLKTKLQGMEAKAIQDQPKVAFAEALETSEGCISVGQLARLINQAVGREVTGQHRLFNWLRGNGWLMTSAGRDYNKPTQKAVSRGYMESKTHLIGRDSKGNAVLIGHTPEITGKGQSYFINFFLQRARLH